MSDLTTLFPAPVAVLMGEDILDVRPLSIGRLAQLARVLAPLLDSGVELTDVQGLLIEHADTVFVAVAIMSGIDRERIEALPPDVFINLASTCIEVNADFFIQAVLPALTGAADRVTGKLAGLTTSSG